MKMKKLTLIQDYHFNFYYTAKELSKKFKINLIGTSNKNLPKFIIFNKWKTYVFLRKPKIFLSKPLSLFKHLKNTDYAIIKDFSQPKSLIAILICRLKKIKYLIVIQKLNWTNSFFLKIVFKFLIKFLIKKDTKIIASIKEGEIKAKKYFKKVEYIPFAIEENKKKIFDKNSKILKILSVGKLHRKRKDHLLLIKALNEINQKIELILIGTKTVETKYYHKLIKEIKKSKIKIIIKENLNIKDMEKEYLNSDLFILPSYSEPVGYAVLEAMSYGLPVICSDEAGAISYLYTNGKVFQARNKESLKEVIKNIAFTKDNKINWNNLEKLGKRSIYIVKKNHNPKIIAKKFEKIINEALK